MVANPKGRRLRGRRVANLLISKPPFLGQPPGAGDYASFVAVYVMHLTRERLSSIGSGSIHEDHFPLKDVRLD